MEAVRNVAVLVGSLRKESFTRKVAVALGTVVSPSLKLEFVEIGGLPMYNQDDEEHPPQPWTAFRQRIRVANAVLFATPEYNRSVPGVLKNAIDVGSRPYGESTWDGKPCAVVSVSPGAIGGFGANHHLRQSLTYLNMPVMQQPEAYVGGASKLFDAQGRLKDEGTRDFFHKFMNTFAAWIERCAK